MQCKIDPKSKRTENLNKGSLLAHCVIWCMHTNWLALPIIWITFLIDFLWLVHLHCRFLWYSWTNNFSVERFPTELMTLVVHMQINSITNSLMSIFTPFVPGLWVFSWLCASNMCTPLGIHMHSLLKFLSFQHQYTHWR